MENQVKTEQKKIEFPRTNHGELIDYDYFRNLYATDKSRKFYLHLVRAFCNKRNVEIVEGNDGSIHCAILCNTPQKYVTSAISDLNIDYRVYLVLMKHIQTQLFRSKTVKWIVQDVKRVLLLQDIREILDLGEDDRVEFSTFRQTYISNIRHRVIKLLHMHDVYCEHNGRLEYAFKILNGDIPLPLPQDGKVFLDRPLVFSIIVPMHPGAQENNTLGDAFAEQLNKLKQNQ